MNAGQFQYRKSNQGLPPSPNLPNLSWQNRNFPSSPQGTIRASSLAAVSSQKSRGAGQGEEQHAAGQGTMVQRQFSQEVFLGPQACQLSFTSELTSQV